MRNIDASLTPLWSLVSGLNLLLSQNIDDDAVCCAVVAKRLQRALRGCWLPPEARQGSEDGYQRHLLYDDEAGRFSIGSFVWKSGQETPVHDHTGWSVVGAVEGELVSENFEADSMGRLSPTSTVILRPGVTTSLTPADGDIHRIVNRSTWATAISIHVYGAPFTAACRSQYDLSNQAGDAAVMVDGSGAGITQSQPVRRGTASVYMAAGCRQRSACAGIGGTGGSQGRDDS